MNVLVINCGSSSVKFRLFRMPEELLLIRGIAEKCNQDSTCFSFSTGDNEEKRSWDEFSYEKSLDEILKAITDPVHGCLSALSEIDAVGHRLIHGGEQGTGCEEISDSLIEAMRDCIPLAPLHYPANLQGIEATRTLMPRVFQAGVFDTAFHHTLPPKAFLYGIPFYWYEKHHIRRYGFHGTSHKYVAKRACEITGLPFHKSRIVSCHLGNGASIAAIKDGRSVDTSMGMTPVEGLLMGSRCGDIDAGILVFLQQYFDHSAEDIQRLINKKGGLLGISGVSADYRVVGEAAAGGNKKARMALEVYHYRIKKYIGAYAAAMGGIDVLVFTGGVGENSIETRLAACREMEFLGIHLSAQKNRAMNGKEASVDTSRSKVRILIIPAREELMIAREVTSLVRWSLKNRTHQQASSGKKDDGYGEEHK